MFGFIIIVSFGAFFLSKILYRQIHVGIFWFFGIIALLNIIYGLFFGQFISDELLRLNIILIPIPVFTFCAGRIFWKKRE